MSDVRDVSGVDPDSDEAGTVLVENDAEPDLPDEGESEVSTSRESGATIHIKRETIDEQERERLLERTRGLR